MSYAILAAPPPEMLEFLVHSRADLARCRSLVSSSEYYWRAWLAEDGPAVAPDGAFAALTGDIQTL